MPSRFVIPFARALLGVTLFAVLNLSCGQYEYSSPLPGMLEVRLKTKNTRMSLLPFNNVSSVNAFPIKLEYLKAWKPGDITLDVFSDVNAIRRNPDGDFFNLLDTLARDSSYVLGKTYAPPGTFSGLKFSVVFPLPGVLVQSGVIATFIEVRTPPIPIAALQVLPEAGGAVNIRIDEGRLTRVTVICDLDSTLERRTEWFELHSKWRISSIQQF